MSPDSLSNLKQYIKNAETGFLEKSSLEVQAELFVILSDSPLFRELRKRLIEKLENNLEPHSAALYPLFLYLTGLSLTKDPKLNGQLLSTVIKRLLTAELQVGGPYRELSGKTYYKANVVIACFLTSQGIHSDKLHTYLLKSPARILRFSKYLYAHSNDAGDYTLEVKAYTAKYLDTYLNSEYFSELQEKDSSYFVLAIATVLHLESKVKRKPRAPVVYNHQARIAYEEIAKDSKNFNEPLRSLFSKCLKKIQEADATFEIAGISAMFADCIGLYPALPIEFYKANIYLWLAYTIYDDFLDDEGVPQLLPVANVAMRSCLETYKNLVLPEQFNKTVLTLFNCMDQANSWEVAHCRAEVEGSKITIPALPIFKNLDLLAERAAGHIIGPLLLLDSAQIEPVQKKKVRLGIHHYLIARQLNDDIHDWKADLKNGQITSTVASFLRKVGIKAGVYEIGTIIEQLEDYFWEEGFSVITAQISRHCRISRNYFETSEVCSLTGHFMKLLSSIEQSNLQSIDTYQQKHSFLHEFHLNPA